MAGVGFPVPLPETCPAGAAWSCRLPETLSSIGIPPSAPALLEALDGLLESRLEPAERLQCLHAWKAPLLAICEDPAGSGVAFEGRLYRLMILNLGAALMIHAGEQTAPETDRIDWAVRNLFRLFQRQIRHAARLGIPIPAGSWRDLHALSAHLILRTDYRRALDQAKGAVDRARRPARKPIEVRYKEILLLGLIAQVSADAVRDPAVADGLLGWAMETRLENPFGLAGQRGLWLVDLREDAPPREQAGPLSSDFRGWILFLPDDFVRRLDTARRADAPGHRHRTATSPARS
jgi:hypothetical protein